jgi:hypothetical protein
MKTKPQVKSRTAVDSGKTIQNTRRATNIFGFSILKQSRKETNKQRKSFWVFNIEPKIKEAK